MLAADTYTDALAEAEAYDRVYTEVLTDPAFTLVAADLLGQLEVDPALAPDAAATTTNALRWALPPHRVRQGTEATIEAVVDYLRGDTDRFRPTVRVVDAVDRVDEAAITFTRTVLGRAELIEVATVDEYEVAVEGVVDELAAGRLPGAVPALAGDVADPEVVAEVIVRIADASDDPSVRVQVVASLEAGDPRRALVDAVAGLVRPALRRRPARPDSAVGTISRSSTSPA